MSTPEQPLNPSNSSDNSFWGVDVLIGRGRFHNTETPIRLMAHIADEPYRRPPSLDDIVPLAQRSGVRTYVLARPYLPIAQLSVIVQLLDTPGADGAIGQVVRSEQVGVRRQLIGKAQAWYYPSERRLTLW